MPSDVSDEALRQIAAVYAVDYKRDWTIPSKSYDELVELLTRIRDLTARRCIEECEEVEETPDGQASDCTDSIRLVFPGSCATTEGNGAEKGPES